MTEEVVVDLSEVDTLRNRVAELEAELRTFRRGYMSKARIEEVIRSKIPATWCDTAIDVAIEAGLIGPDMLDLMVNMGPYGEARISVPADEFEDKSEEEKKTYLSSLLTINLQVQVSGQGPRRKGNTRTAINTAVAVNPTIESWTEVQDTPATGSTSGFEIEAPVGYVFRYTSVDSGRAAHLVQTDRLLRDRPSTSSLCGIYQYQWFERSHWAESVAGSAALRVCQDCRNAAIRLQGSR